MLTVYEHDGKRSYLRHFVKSHGAKLESWLSKVLAMEHEDLSSVSKAHGKDWA